MKMKTKNLMVFFLAIVSVFALVATVSAYTGAFTGDLVADTAVIKVDGVTVDGTTPVSVVAGEKVSVKLYFDSLENASNVRVKAEIEGEKVDVDDRTVSFDVESGNRYSKTLTLEIPSELDDEVSGDLELFLKVWNGDYKSESEAITLNVQRPAYSAEVKSVSVSRTVEAGASLPVDVVLKNVGYNDLEDVYVTVSISELDVEKSAYFGDLVALESDDDDDDEDSANGRIYVDVPYGAEAGSYDIEVTVSNEDTTSTYTKEIVINNDFSAGEVIRNGESLLIMNPTNKLKVYRVVFPESESYVTVSAGSSETVEVNPVANEYTVSVLNMNGEIVKSFVFDAEEAKQDNFNTSDPIVVLTIILAVIFVVLLIVLIVLIGKKPEKSEDFGESYY